MMRYMLKSKLHKATITQADLMYEGSLTIDKLLMEEAGLYPYEKIKIYNIYSGDRFDTYAIEGEAGSGVIGLNGAAARKGQVGDLIIIVSYALYTEDELKNYDPKVVILDRDNKVKERIQTNFSQSSLVRHLF
ncbi:MAG: aspartate 1-decarboxylase [Desulfobulbaceae bacterium DB1]|nr:MAG: aspartate 1-decarboxylase [Desulfobulbaceae bacterium DB1]